jgi:hypothetical protein
MRNAESLRSQERRIAALAGPLRLQDRFAYRRRAVRPFCVLSASFLLFCVSSASLVFGGSIGHTLRFSASDLQVSYQDGYAIPSLPGCEPGWTVGKPMLPIAVCRVLIPTGASASTVEIVSCATETLAGEYQVLPAQMPRPVSAIQAPAFVNPDPAVYQSNQLYPTVPARLQGTGDKTGFRIAEVFAYPLHWLPAQRRLVLSTEITFRVNYEEDKTLAEFRTASQVGSAIEELQGLVLNPEDIRRFAPATKASDPQDLEYVVITSAELAGCFQPLLDWYRETGLTCDVKTREWITVNYPGVDAPERIRNFIIDYYANHGLTYVLLAGDTQIVPCRKGRAIVPGYTDDLPTDLYYADLQWSWDGDHDGIWGEYGDDTVDFYADVYVGRAPVDDSTQAAVFVNKVLGYELEPASGYMSRMLLPYTQLYATPYYSGELAQDSISAFLPGRWQKATLTGLSSTAPIHDSIEAGFGLCHIVAHGNSTGCYTMGGVPIYNVATANSQTNGRKLPVLTSIACYSGNFEYNECLAEALMNNPSGGAVAVIMNSRYGIAQPPGCGPAEKLDIRFYDYLFRLDSFELGRAHSASRDYYAADGRSGGIWQWSLYELNLFGDPRMPVWTAEPEVMLADYPALLNPGVQQVSVRVTSNSLPRAGARVRMFKPGDFDVSGVTGVNGQMSLNVNPQSAGTFHLVVLTQNGVPFRDSGQVRATGACVQCLSHALIDSAPGGNGDGIINPGETIRMPVWFRNFGNQPASGVLVRLRSSDPAVTLLDSMCSLGTLTPGESARAPDFSFAVASSCTNGYLIQFVLHAADQSDSAWDSRVMALVATSALAYQGCLVVDTFPGGNRNSRLDPGETAQLVVRLANYGYGNAFAVSGILRSGDPGLVVPDSMGGFGNIAPDSLGTSLADPFLVRADSAIPRETNVLCSLVVSPAGEPERRLSFLLPVGEMRTCDPVPDTGGASHRYYAYDDGDTGYAQCPTYDWVELRGTGTDLRLDSNDKTVRVNMPFPIRFFGTRYTTISVCSNGWLACGSTVARNWVNHQMPTGSPPGGMICPNWDNLDPGLSGRVWFRYDTTGHRIIIEWDSVAYHDTLGLRETFETIISDTTRATPTGDNEILFQYKTANYFGSSSIGIQNSTSLVGVNYLFDSSYHRAAALILPGRAIKFTTFAPSSGMEERASDVGPMAALEVRPSIFADRAVIRYASRGAGHAELVIYDRAGRKVTGWRVPGNSGSVVWDGRDVSGHRVGAGVYFCRLQSAHAGSACRLVLAR